MKMTLIFITSAFEGLHQKKISTLNKKIKVFEGDATCISDLNNSIENSEIIISTLNVMRKNLFPWSKIINSKATISNTSKNIIEISHRKKIKQVDQATKMCRNTRGHNRPGVLF